MKKHHSASAAFKQPSLSLLVSPLFSSTFCRPGYGNTTPLSATGKVFSICYSLIGVPFTMLVLTVCVQKLLHPLVIAPIGLLHRLGLRLRPATLVHFLLLLALVILGFFVAPAAILSTVEMSWSFLDGIYFCFISLCTIGLGDFVPATEPRQKYRQLYQIGVMGECSSYETRRHFGTFVQFSRCMVLCHSAWGPQPCLNEELCCSHATFATVMLTNPGLNPAHCRWLLVVVPGNIELWPSEFNTNKWQSIHANVWKAGSQWADCILKDVCHRNIVDMATI